MGESESAVPGSIYCECVGCGKTLHSVLKGKVGGKRLDAVLRCRDCGITSTRSIPIAARIKVPVIVSWLSESRKDGISLDSSENVSLDDELVVGSTRVIVTGIESGGRRVSKCPVPKIDTLWAKSFDMVHIKASIFSRKGRTKSAHFLAPPEDALSVGDSVDIGGNMMEIYTIKTKERVLRRNGMGSKMRDIVRIYVRHPRQPRQPRRYAPGARSRVPLGKTRRRF
jgi:uncharacterized Zn finger protein